MLISLLLVPLFSKVYLDNASTTFCDEQVLWVMNQIYRRKLGNPHSSHDKGREAYLEITRAAEILKTCVKGRHVVWTSGATEANNIAILCPADEGKTITCVTEHESVLAPVRHLRNTVFIEVDCHGKIDMATLKQYIGKGARLVSVMLVNNETGVMQPIAQIGALCRHHDVLFHVDAASSFGKIDIDMEKLGIDMLTISGHKIYGPQGIGALVLSQAGFDALNQSGANPLLFGGFFHDRIRPGTLPTVLCAGLGKAAELICQRRDHNFKAARTQKEKFWKEFKERFPKAVETGNPDWPYILNVRVPKEGKINVPLILSKEFVFSAGSACSSGKPSHVLTEMGVDLKNNHVFRFSFGH
jgi:cysteine desulfurase